MYIYVCIYKYIGICVYIYIYIYTNLSLHVHISIVGIKKMRRTDSVTREIKTNQRAYLNVLLIMPHVYEDAYCVGMIYRLPKLSGLVTTESCFRRDVL